MRLELGQQPQQRMRVDENPHEKFLLPSARISNC